MAEIKDLKPVERIFLRFYRFRRLDWGTGARLLKPLSECKLALISSGGMHLVDQAPFRLTLRHADCSFRELPSTLNVRDLRMAHLSKAFDHRLAEDDPNLVFPLDRLREMVERNEIGALNHRHFSFMGAILSPEPLITQTAPEVVAKLRGDGVDTVLLVPV